MNTETWYVMEDGSCGDPRDISPNKDGKLVHKDGRAVAYKPHGPRTRSGVDPEAERAKARAPKPASESRDLKAEKPKGGYATRESKAG
jgi:hypothetical protein